MSGDARSQHRGVVAGGAVRRTVLAALGVTLLGTAAQAQETIFVGGSGQAPVEIYLEAIEAAGPPPVRLERPLLAPGVRGSAFGPVKLRAPKGTVTLARPAPPEVPEAPTPPDIPEPMFEAPQLEIPAPEIALMEPDAPAMEPEPPTVEPVPSAPPEVEVVATEPAAAPVEPTTAPAEQVASLGEAAPGEPTRIIFAAGESELPDDSETLLARLARQLEADPDLRLQLKAYAGGDASSASQARRLSLSRALSVRSYFIEQGVRSTRIDVRALGNRADEGPRERVDVILGKR